MAVDVRGSRGALGLYVLVATAITTAVLAVLAHYLREPFIFPSVGPTIFILFFAPLGLQAAPRNVIGGQLLGIACGYLALVIFGLTDEPADIFDLSSASIGSRSRSWSGSGCRMLLPAPRPSSWRSASSTRCRTSRSCSSPFSSSLPSPLG
jgi:hypothetical protein